MISYVYKAKNKNLPKILGVTVITMLSSEEIFNTV